MLFGKMILEKMIRRICYEMHKISVTVCQQMFFGVKVIDLKGGNQ